MKMQILVLVSIVISSLYVKAAETTLEFLDPCSRTAIAVAPSMKAQIGIRIEGLKPGSRVDAIVELSPVGPREDVIELLSARETTRIRADKKGVAAFGMGAGIHRRLRFDPVARLWQATVKWQSGPEQGTASNRIYLMENGYQRFYQLEKRERSVCSWRKPIEFVSNYLYNREVYDARISQPVLAGIFQPERGIDIGARAVNVRQTGPLFHSETSDGWVFPGFRDVVLQGSFKAEVSEPIPAGEGGVFIRKILYSRYTGREYRLVRKGETCPKWVSDREGYVDVPRVVYDFISLPSSYSQNIESARKVLEESLPPMEPCSEINGGIGGLLSTVIAADRDGAPVHFIPVQDANAKL